mmetsp:Transcript_150/g.448  ORF Transcript_150/g.448 Transcript_150/m.448 type:complete len:277 (+) Transcript_150:848-1678(+)
MRTGACTGAPNPGGGVDVRRANGAATCSCTGTSKYDDDGATLACATSFVARTGAASMTVSPASAAALAAALAALAFALARRARSILVCSFHSLLIINTSASINIGFSPASLLILRTRGTIFVIDRHRTFPPSSPSSSQFTLHAPLPPSNVCQNTLDTLTTSSSSLLLSLERSSSCPRRLSSSSSSPSAAVPSSSLGAIVFAIFFATDFAIPLPFATFSNPTRCASRAFASCASMSACARARAASTSCAAAKAARFSAALFFLFFFFHFFFPFVFWN